MQPWELVVDSSEEVLWSHRGFIDTDELYSNVVSILSSGRSYAGI